MATMNDRVRELRKSKKSQIKFKKETKFNELWLTNDNLMRYDDFMNMSIKNEIFGLKMVL
jgi:hypothetical protein